MLTNMTTSPNMLLNEYVKRAQSSNIIITGNLKQILMIIIK